MNIKGYFLFERIYIECSISVLKRFCNLFFYHPILFIIVFWKFIIPYSMSKILINFYLQ